MMGAVLSNLILTTNYVLRNAIEEFVIHENNCAQKILNVPALDFAKIRTTNGMKASFLNNQGWRSLMARAGCLACDKDIFDELRAVARVMLNALVRDAVTYTEHSPCRTVLVSDILRASLRNVYTLGSVPIGSGFLSKALPTWRILLPGNTIDWAKAAEAEVRVQRAGSEDSDGGEGEDSDGGDGEDSDAEEDADEVDSVFEICNGMD